MTTTGAAVLWFRQDLRLADHPALTAALRHKTLLPVFIWSPADEGAWAPGAASRWWLHDSLASLSAALAEKGSQLIIRSGDSRAILLELAKKYRVETVYWSRRYEPAAILRDKIITAALKDGGVGVESCKGTLLHEPPEIQNKAGGPYLVYGAFWRALLQRRVAEPLPKPKRLPPLPGRVDSLALDALSLKPKGQWDSGLRQAWKPGEAYAHKALAAFCKHHLSDYGQQRDMPALPGTSRLSPHLHFGELSPRQVWRAATAAVTPLSREGLGVYQKEIVWREFSYHLLYHFPHLTTVPLRQAFLKFPWQDNAAWLHAWQRGQTGYPIVDAGMRELWHTGWMHNRVRMIVASFLVKDLRIAWQRGAAWFWDTLVDADLASNTQGWQWTAGCGADAAPYFRIFNPVLQGKKFDPDGAYVRHWVPELARLPDKFIHQPWAAPPAVLSAAGVTLGSEYPEPVVDHGRARFAALKAFDQIKGMSITQHGVLPE